MHLTYLQFLKFKYGNIAEGILLIEIFLNIC